MGHFDMKPENIFMMNKYTPIIGDLGLTSTFEKAKLKDFKGGTMYYLPQNVADEDVEFNYD